jgi:uncharacterized protein YndB with AHSA1/START domain
MSERATNSWTIDVETPPEAAFEYLTDIGRYAEWSPKPYRVDPVPTLPLQQGVTFESFGVVPGNKDHANQVEVTLVEAPHRLVLTSTDKGERYVHQFDIVASGRGSRITRTVEAPRPTGLVRLVFPLIFAVFINPEVTKGMKMLKDNLAVRATHS